MLRYRRKGLIRWCRYRVQSFLEIPEKFEVVSLSIEPMLLLKRTNVLCLDCQSMQTRPNPLLCGPLFIIFQFLDFFCPYSYLPLRLSEIGFQPCLAGRNSARVFSALCLKSESADKLYDPDLCDLSPSYLSATPLDFSKID